MLIQPKLLSLVKDIGTRAKVDLSALLKTEPERDLGNGTVSEERTFADKILGRSTVTRRAPTQAAPAPAKKPYSIPERGIDLDDDDLKELKNVLYAEISNRDPEKQKLESRVIINTALNRIGQYKEKGRELSLADVLREPNQYQGYNPDNEKSQYNVAKTGKGSPEKLSVIDEILGELSGGKFEDNTNGAAYYVHHPDGRIEFDDKRPLFADTKLSKGAPSVVMEDDGTWHRDMSEDEISQYSFRDKVDNVVEKIKQNVPFLESNFEKAVKGEIQSAYPFTPQIQDLLGKVNIANKTDTILAPFIKEHLSADDSYLKEGARAPSGMYTPWRGPTTIKVAQKIMPLLKKLPSKLFSAAVGEEIQLDDLSAATGAHELTHAIFHRTDIEPKEFNDVWEQAKKEGPRTSRLLKYIDEHMDEAGYEVDGYNQANERFAYLLEYAGEDGLVGMPTSLRKFYEGILKDKREARPGDDDYYVIE